MTTATMEAPATTPPTGTPMRLADALRHADRVGIPNKRGGYIEARLSEWGGEAPPVCPIGAASVVTGAFVFETRYIEGFGNVLTPTAMQSARLPNVAEDIWADRRGLRCPVVDCPPGIYLDKNLANVVAHLNDNHHWSRTAIADWLDGLEAA